MSTTQPQRSPIFKRTYSCLAAFKRLIESLQEPRIETTYGVSSNQVHDLLDRFKIWAGNIGAFSPLESKSSLDYRIRDAPKIGTQITALLDDLSESLDDVCSILRHVKDNRTGSVPTEVIGTDLNDAVNDGVEKISEIREIIESSSDAIKHLFRYSILIRNNTNRDRYAKSAAAAISSPFRFNEDFDISHVKHKFPALQSNQKDWLTTRLGKAITQRRQYLRYCREHHDKTSKMPEQGPVRQQSNPFDASNSSPSLRISARSELSPPTSTLPHTQATTLVLVGGQMIEEEVLDEVQSQTSYATSVDEESLNDKLQVVPLEEVQKGSEHFECPYCWQIQACKSQKAWRKHVLSDLRPYVCTFDEKCELKLFSNQHEWFSHELKDHRREWRCHFCTSSTFRSSKAYTSHLETNHSDSFAKDQLQALFDMSQRPLVQFSPSACPFCSDWEVKLRAVNQQVSSLDTLLVTPHQFQKHLGAHMEQLALFAIPRGYFEEGEVDSARAVPQQNSSAPPSAAISALKENPPWHKFCEDVLNKLRPNPLAQAFMKPSALPTISLSSFGRHQGHYTISSLDLPRITAKLQNGEYTSEYQLQEDLYLMLLVYRATKSRDSQAYEDCEQLEILIEGFFRTEIGLPHDLITLLDDMEKEIRWRAFKIRKLSAEPGPSDAVRKLVIKMQNEVVSKTFRQDDHVEDIYAFVECWDWIKIGFSPASHDEPPEYVHQYHFKLKHRPVEDSEPTTIPLNHKSKIGACFISSDIFLVEPLLENDLLEEFQRGPTIKTPEGAFKSGLLGTYNNPHEEERETLESSSAPSKFVFDAASVREWTDISGTMKVTAQYFAFKKEKLYIYKPNGVILGIPAYFMSDADLDFVEDHPGDSDETFKKMTKRFKPPKAVIKASFKATRIQEITVLLGDEVVILDSADMQGCCLVALVSTGNAGLIPSKSIGIGVDSSAQRPLPALRSLPSLPPLPSRSEGSTDNPSSSYYQLHNLVENALEVLSNCEKSVSNYSSKYAFDILELHQTVLMTIDRLGATVQGSDADRLNTILAGCVKALEKTEKGTAFYEQTGKNKGYQGLVHEAWEEMDHANRDVKAQTLLLKNFLNEVAPEME